MKLLYYLCSIKNRKRHLRHKEFCTHGIIFLGLTNVDWSANFVRRLFLCPKMS